MSWITQVLFDTASPATGIVSSYNSGLHSRGGVDEVADDSHRNDDFSIEGMVIDFFQGLNQNNNNNSNNFGVDEESFGGQTILSSDPSAPTVAEEDLPATVGPAILATSPSYPLRRNPLSMSTAESMTLEFHGDNDSVLSAASSADTSLSFQPSLLDSAITFSTGSSSLQQQRTSTRSPWLNSNRNDEDQDYWSTASHHPEVLVSTIPVNSTNDTASLSSSGLVMTTARNSRAIAFPRSNNNNNNNNNGGLVWYANFHEDDWYALRETAKMVLRALEFPPPNRNQCLRPQTLPPIPPEPLPTNSVPSTSIRPADKTLGALHFLPSCFICSFCQDAIVGALQLDCNCQTIVCTACWEYHCVTKSRRCANTSNETFDMARDLGYTVIVDHDANTTTDNNTHDGYHCPRCFQPVNNPLDCHALDVAILQIVKNLSAQSDGSCSHLQQSYYRRLKEWRAELMRRQQEMRCPQDDDDDDGVLQRNELYVAQLIQAEEEYLWRRPLSHETRRRKPLMFPEFATVSVIVAAMASIGFRMLLQPPAASRS